MCRVLPSLSQVPPSVMSPLGQGSTSPQRSRGPPGLSSPALQSPVHGLGNPTGSAMLTLAVAAVGGQPVSRRRAAALEASSDVDAAIGTDVAASGQGAFVNVCNGNTLSIPTGPQAGLRSRQQAAMGHLDTGSLRMLGRPQKLSCQKGKMRPREGKELA